ncbi:MAG: hypothetical protein VCF07_03555 [Nitrospinota bacterium]
MEKCKKSLPLEDEKCPSWERLKKVQLQREEISKRPYLTDHLYEEFAQPEINFLTKYYDNVERIIAVSKLVPWDKLPTCRYQYKVGSYDDKCRMEWNEDLQIHQKICTTRRPIEVEVGLVQQAFVAAMRQSNRTGEKILKMGCISYVMTPPCNLDTDIQGAGCRLLWGRSFSDHFVDENFHEFDFFMSGREFVVSAKDDFSAASYLEGNGGIEHLSVTVLRGEPLDNPCWGTLLP